MNYTVLSQRSVPNSALDYETRCVPWLRHPVYACLGLRPAIAQHTAAEHAALKRWAGGRRALVEIGVAEGVSALALREGMSEDGTLTLIDPFHLSRAPVLNFLKRAAHRVVNSCDHGKVVWIEKFSGEAVQLWRGSVDLILIDGDHSEIGVQRDWEGWSHFVKPGGVVIFHDARLFESGWTKPEYGPLKLVNRVFREGHLAGWSITEEVDSLVMVKREY